MRVPLRRPLAFVALISVSGIGVGLIGNACHDKSTPSAATSVDGSAPTASAAGSPASSASAEIDDLTSDEPDAAAMVDPDAVARPSDAGDPRFADLPPRTVQLNGPFKVASKAMQAWVHMYPDDETPYLGYLRVGAIVDRSAEPIVRTKRCRSGWYEVLPRGYLCAGRRATLDVQDPIVVASWKHPKRGEPLPYTYVRPGEPAPYLYFTLPSMKDQIRTEGPGLKEHLGRHPPSRYVDALGSPEPIPDFLEPGKELPNPYGATRRLRYRVQEGKANPRAAFALLSLHEHEGRLFGLTTELALIAIDRTRIVTPPTAHGGPIDGLPAGVVLSYETPSYAFGEDGKPKKIGTYQKRNVVSFTGNTRDGMNETVTGTWIPAGTFRMIEARTSFPSFATEGRKWIDISIKEQLLVAYVATKAVYATFVSTGLGEMGDPEKTFATVRGAYTIKSKHITATMTGGAPADYELADVPYVQYFHESFALHGTFWHDNFGRVYSHGCINLPPVDAAWLFEWTDPAVPPDWHGALATTDQPGTVVYVHH